MTGHQENQAVMDMVNWFMSKDIGPSDALLVLTKALVVTLAYLSIDRPHGTLQKGSDLVAKIIKDSGGERGQKVLDEVKAQMKAHNHASTLI